MRTYKIYIHCTVGTITLIGFKPTNTSIATNPVVHAPNHVISHPSVLDSDGATWSILRQDLIATQSRPVDRQSFPSSIEVHFQHNLRCPHWHLLSPSSASTLAQAPVAALPLQGMVAPPGYMSHLILRSKPDAHRMYAQDQVIIHTTRM
jgi:hypothetical protein